MYSTSVQREHDGRWVVLAAQACTDARSARVAESVRVTEGHPADNRSTTLASANHTHERFGERNGAFDVRERAQAHVGEHRVDAWYASARDAMGYTKCSVYANATNARGSAVLRQTPPACVPQDLLLP